MEYKCNDLYGCLENDFCPVFNIMSSEDKILTIEIKNSIKGSVSRILKGRNRDARINSVSVDDEANIFVEFECDKAKEEGKIALLLGKKMVLPFSVSEWKDGKKIAKSIFEKTDGALLITNYYKHGAYWKKEDIFQINLEPYSSETIFECMEWSL